VERDYFKAVDYFKQAAALGYAQAHHQLGECYLKGNGVACDLTESLNFYKLAAHSGHLPSIFALGSTLIDCGFSTRSKEAIEYIEKAAQAGYTLALFYLADLLHNGNHISQNYLRAEQLFRKAALQGFLPAQYRLAQYLLHGSGSITPDIPQALYYFRLAADSGHNISQYKLGIFYLNGNFVDKDIPLAAHYLKLAADSDYTLAEVTYGKLLTSNSILINHDQNEESVGAQYLKKAAEKGDRNAMNFYAWCLKDAIGVPQDLELAFYYYKRAAEIGNNYTMRRFGELLGRHTHNILQNTL